MREFGLREATILTEDFEGEEKVNGGRIAYKSLWRWGLEEF
jgi:predicted AAA+ superfamily ATPase